jgi:DNA-binding NarL/FixJ family response regulator
VPEVLRVFIADDSLGFGTLAGAWLEGYEDIDVVGTARTAPDAIARLTDARPDVVLLDLLDVERDAVGELQAVAPQVRVVVLSGHPREYGERRRGGAVAYVEKDAPIAELRETVLRAARG